MFFGVFEKLSMGLVFVIITYAQLLVDGVFERKREREEREVILLNFRVSRENCVFIR